MTMEDELRKMTAGEAISNSVSTFKTPLKSFDGRLLRAEIRNDGYDNRQQIHIIWGDLSNVEADNRPLVGDEFDWAVNKPAKVTKNSPLGMFLISGAALQPNLDNLMDIIESKLKFHVERIVIPGEGTDRTGKPMSDSSGYELKSIINGSGPVAAAPAEANPATLAAVLQFANGLTEEQFNQSVLRDLPAAAADPVTRGKIIARTFLKEAVEAGQLAVNDGTYNAVPTEAPATA